ncbi:MAG TPA: DUF4234 domain-containing protein [Solirubrobacterales bacterium]
MVTCPYCSTGLEGAPRVCAQCGRALVQRCVACAEDIPVLSQVCPLCKTPQSERMPAKPAPVVPYAPAPAQVHPIGEDRSIILVLVLWFVTCGVWGLVALYQIGSDLKTHRPQADISPGLDILLGILTCGIWFIFAVYKYAQILREISEQERGPVQDVTTICLVLQICKYFGCPGIISVMFLQNELNVHWRRHLPA